MSGAVLWVCSLFFFFLCMYECIYLRQTEREGGREQEGECVQAREGAEGEGER